MQHRNAETLPTAPTILAVDDEASYLRFLSELLSAEGYQVLTETDGARALAIICQRQPDLVLLDLHLAGGIDGIAVCNGIKNNPGTSSIPVIAITGLQNDRTRISALLSGANEFLAKPVDPAELLLRVRNTFRLKQAEELRTRNELLLSHQASLEAKNRELEAALSELQCAENARLRAEQQRQQMQARVQRLEQAEMVGRVAVGVAHEVRTPLHAITAVTEALCLKLGGGEDFAPYIKHLRTQVNRLAELMSELLEFGKPLDPERVRAVTAREICRDIEEFWRIHPAAAAHPLHVALPILEAGTIVRVDPAKQARAVLNLLENGANHSPAGSPLQLRVFRDGAGFLVLAVIDAGTGVDAGMHDKVFQPFFTTRHHGTGLGLSIVQRIAEDCGGRVELRANDRGPGTAALFSIPFAGETGR